MADGDLEKYGMVPLTEEDMKSADAAGATPVDVAELSKFGMVPLDAEDPEGEDVEDAPIVADSQYQELSGGTRTHSRGLDAGVDYIERDPTGVSLPSKMAAGALAGAAGGASWGFADELYGGAMAAGNALGLTDMTYDEAKQEATQLLDQARNAAPGSAMIGDIIAGAYTGGKAASLLGKLGSRGMAELGKASPKAAQKLIQLAEKFNSSGSKATKVARVAKNTAPATVSGALRGAGESEGKSFEEVAKDAVELGGISMATSLVGQGLSSALAKGKTSRHATILHREETAAQKELDAFMPSPKKAVKEDVWQAELRGQSATERAKDVLKQLRDDLGEGPRQELRAKAAARVGVAQRRIEEILEQADNQIGEFRDAGSVFKQAQDQIMDNAGPLQQQEAKLAKKILKKYIDYQQDATKGLTVRSLQQDRAGLSDTVHKLAHSQSHEDRALYPVYKSVLDSVDNVIEHRLDYLGKGVADDFKKARQAFGKFSEYGRKLSARVDYKEPKIELLKAAKSLVAAGMRPVIDQLAKFGGTDEARKAITLAAERGPQALAAQLYVWQRSDPEAMKAGGDRILESMKAAPKKAVTAPVKAAKDAYKFVVGVE